MDRLRERVARSVAGRDALPAADAGPDDRRRDRADRSTASRSRAPTARRSTHWASKLVAAAAQTCRRCATSAPTPARRAWRPTSTSTATPPRAWAITASAVDDALYSAFGQRIVSTIFTETNQYRVILEAQPGLRDDAEALGKLQPAAPARGQPTPLSAIATHHRAAGAAADHARRASTRPRTHRLRHRARRLARRARSTRSARPRKDIGLPAGVTHDLPRRVGRLRDVARQPAVADPGGGRLRLHRAGRAVRELHPPADDPVDAAVGRRRRAARADAHRQRPRRDRHHRHHPADRHRQEERDHDDRLRDRRRARRGQERRARRSTRRRCCASGRS